MAQMAAVVGREFSYDLLRRVSSLEDEELEASLAGLEEHEIVRRIDRRRPVRYAFRHALLRDSAYESLLKSRRRRIHGKVAAAIDTRPPYRTTLPRRSNQVVLLLTSKASSSRRLLRSSSKASSRSSRP